MQIERNISLKQYNTFGVQVRADYFAAINKIADFQELLLHKSYEQRNKMILGGGSNVLFTKDFDGLVIKNNLKGIDVIEENENHVWIKCGAGEVWHDLVLACIDKNYAGLENLSLIPGMVGASPMQNIGAYGVEVKDFVARVACFDMASGEAEIYQGSECEFGYRTSIFKTKYKNRKFIEYVVFKLNKKATFNTSYGAIEQELERLNIQELSLKAISQAVINIRSRKLPDPKLIGNAGSFFKNPVIDEDKANKLLNKFPNIPLYPAPQGLKKVAAGWLIEKAGWKGKRVNDHGVHQAQALVLVNYGGATGSSILQLAEDIQQSIRELFDIELEKEVNVI
ncbi:MAG: UDP-N-acetylmuramate dehydrogenase [Vicingaceae bacterium]